MMIASPIWGNLADRYGRKPMVVRAMFGGGITIFFMGFIHTAEQLIALRCIQGLLSGVLSAANALIVSKAPRNKIGYCMGVLQLGLWSGTSIGPLIGGYVSDQFGFRVTFLLTSFLLVVAGISVLVGIKEVHAPTPVSDYNAFSFVTNCKRLFSNRRLMSTFSLRFLNSIGRTALLPILPLFVQSLFVTGSQTAGFTGLILGLSSVSSTISAIYLGKLGDHIGHCKVAFYSALMTAVFYIPQSFVYAPWQLMILYTITGAGIGGLTPSLAALLAHFSKPADAGSVYGFDNSIISAGRTISPLLAMWTVNGLGPRAVFTFTGAMFLISTPIIGLLGAKMNSQRFTVNEPSPLIEDTEPS